MLRENGAYDSYVVVSATALDQSGALTILKQFLKQAASDKHRYLCFVPVGLKLGSSDNIRLIEIDRKSWLSRILWDAFQLKRWLKNNNIVYHRFISLQDTTVNIDVDQIIYLHQPLPFSTVKWNPLKRTEFKLFLYKHFFSYFIFRYLADSTIFVVQTKWMKRALCDRRGLKPQNVKVIQPDIMLPDLSATEIEVQANGEFYNILYPATPLVYKNHLILLQALHLLGQRRDISGVRINLTFSSKDYPGFHQLALKFGLESNINYLGVLPYEDLIIKYRSSDLIAFPSYIETFGLPLAEAACLGKEILSSDTEFAREVLNQYSGVEYLDAFHAEPWAAAIERRIDIDNRATTSRIPFQFQRSGSWEEFFALLQP